MLTSGQHQVAQAGLCFLLAGLQVCCLANAGFDAHWRDPLESLNFQSSTYHWLTRRIKELSNKLSGELHRIMTACVSGSFRGSGFLQSAK